MDLTQAAERPPRPAPGSAVAGHASLAVCLGHEQYGRRPIVGGRFTLLGQHREPQRGHGHRLFEGSRAVRATPARTEQFCSTNSKANTQPNQSSPRPDNGHPNRDVSFCRLRYAMNRPISFVDLCDRDLWSTARRIGTAHQPSVFPPRNWVTGWRPPW